ncbi:MAG: uracil-DNA glycosylase [Desulfurococcales archaeon]|nr:uracil-DNA glycosylase [Desulfurococcales archaeon]
MKNLEDERVLKMTKLIDEIKKCTKCPLYKHRTNPVPGEGPLDAKVMFIGEAPGRNEDLQGRPFVGRAGELLDYLLGLARLTRESVYITNVVKCRPPNNRDPEPEEIHSCLPYLKKQIKIIQPKIIVCLGRFAGSTIFRLARLKWDGMYRTHGKVYSATVEGIPVKLTATFHPASAFYKKEVRALLEEDFGKVIKGLVQELAEPRKDRKTLLDFM